MLELLVFSDYICPWCYLGNSRIGPLIERFELRLRRVHFPLHPNIPAEGRALRELFGDMDMTAAHARLGAALAAEGLPFSPGDRTFRTREAQELASWADAQGGPPLHAAVFRAVFVEGRNIGQDDVLLDIAEAAGHPRAAAAEALTARLGAGQVDADHHFARSLGVRSVPTFVIGRTGVAGAQPLSALVALAKQAGAVERIDAPTVHP